jgi:predicted esterase
MIAPVLLLALIGTAQAPSEPPPVTRAPTGLTRVEADAFVKATLRSQERATRAKRAAELKSGVVEAGGTRMRIWSTSFGEAGKGKLRPLWISMHGGGGAPARVNDQQWENQKRLYRPAEGVYVAPRAPSDEWNLWHQAPIDQLFARLIEDVVICERVDPDRVYLLGYSAGGDGVYQLAPRMADRFAAAAMMAGHPNEAVPDGLRNLPFTIQMGALDAAFDRNRVAGEWGKRLDALSAADPGAYVHRVDIRAGKGHWMDGEDAEVLPWMAGFVRDPRPKRIVWVQDDVTHPRSYWLAVDSPKAGDRIVAERQGQEIRIIEAPAGKEIRIRLDDAMVDLEQDVTVVHVGQELFRGRVLRSRDVIRRVLGERHDPSMAFTAEIAIRIP